MNIIVYETSPKNKFNTLIKRIIVFALLFFLNISVLTLSYIVLLPNSLLYFSFIVFIFISLDISSFVLFNKQIKYENDIYKIIDNSFISRNSNDLECASIDIKKITKIKLVKNKKKILYLTIYSENNTIHVSGLNNYEYKDIIERLGFDYEN